MKNPVSSSGFRVVGSGVAIIWSLVSAFYYDHPGLNLLSGRGKKMSKRGI